MIAVAMASFKEAVRKKLILLIGLLTLVYIIILTLITHFGYNSLKSNPINSDALSSNAALIVSFLGYYFSSMIIALLTIMASLGAVSSEIENGAVQSIVTKPIKRSHYILGKYLGLAALVTAYSLFLYITIFVINYTVGVPPLDKPDVLILLKGLLLFILEPLSILSLCILGSTAFKTLNNGIIVIAIYILGTIGSMMEQIGSGLKIDGLVEGGILISLISPFETVYRKLIEVVFSSSDISFFFTSPLFISGSMPSNWMILYVVIYLVALLMLSIHKFNRKDIS